MYKDAFLCSQTLKIGVAQQLHTLGMFTYINRTHQTSSSDVAYPNPLQLQSSHVTITPICNN
jgi:hypothetical protein